MSGEAKEVIEAEDDDEFEIEVVDDTPEVDKGRARKDGDDADVPDDDAELADYGAGVQKRIKKLKFEFHEERRRGDTVARERDEAIRVAQVQQHRIQELSDAVTSGRTNLHETESTSAEAKLAAARLSFNKAFSDGDADAITKASEDIAGATASIERIKTVTAQDVDNNKKAVAQQQYNAALQAQRQAQARPRPDPTAADWAGNNPWFQKDNKMTAVAMGVHQDMVEAGNPIGSPDYYKKLDTEMRSMFPSYFKETRPGSVVAPASRGGGNKPRGKVTLTATQVAIAKKLGVTPQQYAAEMQTINSKDD